jgi:hypothetical protein
MKNLLKLCFVILIFSSCEEDCPLAETGPVGFVFEVVDKQTRENLFANGTYEQNQISIKNKKGEEVEYKFISENNINRISVLLGWETKTDVYTVQIGSEVEFDIAFSLVKIDRECNDPTKLEELKIEGIESEPNENTGVTQILVP